MKGRTRHLVDVDRALTILEYHRLAGIETPAVRRRTDRASQRARHRGRVTQRKASR